ncbi:2,5-diketo-D-gluconic acid reductase [Tetragenococcus halophilus subsp. flandriensis]|uniref:aldo/keto reductase n=1 Tax=Tetragenococcus halophilus TaxID=51669 RepID=UPI0023E95EEA|nr:aldo/keto reductase [Tetragenococcus halophilus]GMA07997.1 2,5-diketo-D-gluconic acid reductase [Tetragenococcus halophilus subsp. flandriensis]
MSILTEEYTLSNGVKIPKIGFGTWLVEDDKVVEPVKNAIEMGYRHIDTAQAYENERGVGQGIRDSGIAREDIFLTTKLAAEIKSYDEAVKAIDESLEKAGVDYFDLMIIHSPQPWSDFRNGEHFYEGNLEAWRAMEEAYNAGKLHAIGVSNFEQKDLENILENGTVKPMVNQVLTHVSNTPFDLIEFCQKQDILVEAYSPVAHGEILDNKEIKELAEKYNVSPAQLSIRYCLQLGLLPLPKSENPDHIRSNAELDFEISAEDLNKMKQMEQIKDYGESNAFPVFEKGL